MSTSEAEAGDPIRRFYRLVLTDPPALLDFSSKAVLGIPAPATRTSVVRLWSGISVFATAAQARRVARVRPRLGAYIAVLNIAESREIVVERTRGPGHHTIWGEPSHLLATVLSVEPV